MITLRAQFSHCREDRGTRSRDYALRDNGNDTAIEEGTISACEQTRYAILRREGHRRTVARRFFCGFVGRV